MADDAIGSGGAAGNDLGAGPVIRRAVADDLDVIVSIVAAAYRSTGGQRGWTSEDDLLAGQRADVPMVQAIMDDERSVLLVAEVGGAVRGCIQLEPLDGGGAHFGLFAVDPTLQSGGVGGGLLTAVETLAGQDWGCRWMQLEVLRQRVDLIAWYARRGYEPTGETLPFPYGDERFQRSSKSSDIAGREIDFIAGAVKTESDGALGFRAIHIIDQGRDCLACHGLFLLLAQHRVGRQQRYTAVSSFSSAREFGHGFWTQFARRVGTVSDGVAFATLVRTGSAANVRVWAGRR